MYQAFFGFKCLPFSIVPNSKSVYLGLRHGEALQHLQLGLSSGGGFALLTGEVGTGKTTVAKTMLTALNEQTQAGLILNPTFSSQELLEAICDEFGQSYSENATLKQLTQILYQHLLANHSQGKQSLLVIDEAQHLAVPVFEQLRLLTNLETDSQKLLKVLLVGQPELQQALKTPQLRQLAQRITGRYHLLPLTVSESEGYVQFRLQQAGASQMVFTPAGIKLIAQAAHGIPRLINLICDHALQLSYRNGEKIVTDNAIQQSISSVMALQGAVYDSQLPVDLVQPQRRWLRYGLTLCTGIGIAYATWMFSPAHIKGVSIIQQPSEIAVTKNNVVLSNTQSRALEPSVDAISTAMSSTKETSLNESDLFAVPHNLSSVLTLGKNKAAAVQTLFHLWGYEATVADSFCRQSPQSLFACQKQQISLDDIVRENVPVVLVLEASNTPVYGVLYRVINSDESSTKVDLLIGNKRLRMDLQVLKLYWQGESLRVWPSDFNSTLKLHDEGLQVGLLNQRLNLLLGEPNVKSDYFDQKLQEKVKLFQRWQKLYVDGVAGQKTLNRIEQLSANPSPYLIDIAEEQS